MLLRTAEGEVEGHDHRRMQGQAALLASYVESVCVELVPTGVSISRLGVKGRKWYLLALLFLEMSPEDLCPSSTCCEISKQISLLYILVIFQITAFILYFS